MNLVDLLVAFGLGAAVTAVVKYFLDRKSTAEASQRTELEARYRVVILLMYAVVYPEDNQAVLESHRPDLQSKHDVINELKAEWHNMLLFASSRTLDELHSFINKPSDKIYRRVASSMRKDLGRGEINDKILNLSL